MDGRSLGAAIVRFFQLIIGAIVLGVAVVLVNKLKFYEDACRESGHGDQCDVGSTNSAVEYAAFVGAFGLLDALVGLAAAFVEAIPWLVTLGFEALSLIFYVAGAIRFSVLLRGPQGQDFDNILTYARTTEAFLWIGFIATLAAIALVILMRNR